MKEKFLKYTVLIFFIFIIPALAKKNGNKMLPHQEFASVSQTQEKEIISLISQEKEKHNLKAVVFGIWKNNKLITSGALGESMEGTPATTDMHFRIGAVTETMLTTLLLQLVDEGKVKLDDPISQWRPELPNANLVTLKMLANSTSGYPDFEKSEEFEKDFHKNVFKQWTTKELLDYAFKSPPLFEPGTQWSYSHTNFMILGDILEKITHQSIPQLFQGRIFNKLGLNHTEASLTPMLKHPVLHAYTSERGIYEDSTYWSPSWTSFSGLVSSNMEDLGKWIHAFGTGTLLSKESYQIMHTPVSIKKGDRERGFALGFVVLNSWFVQIPRFGGYSGYFAYLPEKKLGIVIFNTLNPQNSTEVNYSQMIVTELIENLTPDHLLPKGGK